MVSFDELFAYRVALQDLYTDERIIIKKLKLFLIDNNIPQNEINDFLKDFYKNYDIELDDGFIESIQPIVFNVSNFLYNLPINITFQNNIQYDNNIQNNNNIQYDDNESVDSDLTSLDSQSTVFTSLSDVITNLMETTFNEFEDVRATLNQDKINNLEKIKITEETEDDCNICLDKMEKETEVIKLKCNHYFHPDCITKWLKDYNYKCPICREETDVPEYT